MGNERWSEWIDWSGGECPLPDDAEHAIKIRNGETQRDDEPQSWRWQHNGGRSDIIAYRYKIKEAEVDMHPDLEWLARNVSEWNPEPFTCDDPHDALIRICGGRKVERYCGPNSISARDPLNRLCTYSQWLQARKDLGLIMSDEEEEIEADDWGASIPEGVQVFQHGHKLDPKAVDDLWLAQVSNERMNEESIKVSIDELQEEAGQKYDSDKPAMDLIPPYMEEEVGMVLAFGAQKYAPDNWRKVTPLRSRYLAAAQRHINALKKGEQMDPESGLHHAAHAVCCLMFLGEVELEPSK